MKLSIRNYRAIESADIDIDNIALICAHNWQGKTAISQALQSCLTKQKVVIEGLKVGDSKNLVKDGAKSGSIKISNNDSEINILYPKATVMQAGDDIKSSRIACGLDSFGKMDKKEAAKLIYQILSVSPSEEDFYSMIVQSSKDAGFNIPVSELEKVWKALQIVGWEKCQKDISEQAKLAKGAWQQITGQTWGSSKAEGWFPEGYDESVPPVTEEAIKEAEKKYADAIANKAINGEVRAMLEAQAANAESLRAKYSADKCEINKQQEKLQELDFEISELLSNIKLNTALSCPCCNENVSFKDGVLVKSTASSEVKAVSESVLKETQEERAAQYIKIEQLLTELNKTLEQGKIAGDAARQLEKAGEVKESSELQETEAKIALSQLCSLKDEQETYAKATEKQTLIRNYLHISDELSETGVRKRRLKAILEEFNAKMLLVNTAKQTYQLSTLPMVSTGLVVRDKGIALSLHTTETTLMDLQNESIPTNHYSIYYSDNGEGTFIRTGTNLNNGVITVDGNSDVAANETAAYIADYILENYGGISGGFTSASVTALDGKNSSVIGIWTGVEESTVGEWIDIVLQSVAGYWTITSNGDFTLGRLEAPAGSADHTINDYLLIGGKDKIQRAASNDAGGGLPAKRCLLNWGKNYTVLNGTDIAGAALATVGFYEQEYRVAASAINTTTLAKHPLAQEINFTSQLTTQANAQTEVDRLGVLYKNEYFNVDISVQAVYSKNMQLGQTIALEDVRTFYARNYLLTGISNDYKTDFAKLQLLAIG